MVIRVKVFSFLVHPRFQNWTNSLKPQLPHKKRKLKNLGFLGRGFSSHLRLGGICTSPALKMHQRNLKLENLKISKISNSRNQKKLPECFIFPLQCIDLTGAGAGDINMKVASLLNLKNVQFTSLLGNPETKIEKVEEYEFKKIFVVFVTTSQS